MTRTCVPLPIAADHPAFAGHFPGRPIVPGVVLLDEVLHAIGASTGVELARCTIASAKFLSPVSPGEPVALCFEAAANNSLRFELSSGERLVATGSIRLQE